MKLDILDDKALIDYEISADIFSIEEQKRIFLEAIHTEKPIFIKTDRLDLIVTASLQLLISLKKNAQGKGLSVEFENPSSAFIYAADLIGISEILNIHGS